MAPSCRVNDRMKAFRTGVVIGKFLPPHKGHHFLIETASAQTEQLYVIVCEHPDQEIPGEVRAACLREVHPEAEVRVVDDVVAADDSAGWAEYTCRVLGFHPEAAFTSEDYGQAWAAAMGARHVLVDRQRVSVPCSGTMVRADPLGHLEWLSPFMRAVYVRRVCVLGAESTGTTTLARALARHYGTGWVSEYGREYSEMKWKDGYTTEWRSEELAGIAMEQSRREDVAARSADRVLICDTDAFATGIWHRRYVGGASAEIEAIAEEHRADLYLLTGDEIPFEQDGLRDGEHVRHAMHAEFARELATTGRPFVLLRGPHATRMTEAVRRIDALLAAPVLPRASRRPRPPR
jgi:HTH-type transcriptional repressor of NAD biosynthesis genes